MSSIYGFFRQLLPNVDGWWNNKSSKQKTELGNKLRAMPQFFKERRQFQNDFCKEKEN